MSFYARNFVFDGIIGATWGLNISSSNPENNSDASSDVQLITDTIYRKSKPYLYGIQQSPVLSFDIELNSEDKIDALLAPIIAKKLFGQLNYKKLQILQPDMEKYYFNCFLTSPKIKRVGGEIVGWNATVLCDSPFAWTFTKTTTFSYPTGIASGTILFNNQSSDNFYMFPTTIVTMNTFGGNLTITNTSDNDRVFQLTTLTAGEVITLNSELETIDSSLGLLRLSHFNKKWPRFVPGRNDLTISGAITSLQYQYQNAIKIGG